MDYPQRCAFFAHKFVRLLTKSCAAQDIGRDAFCLLCVVVHQEDSARYAGPVRFWNEQLMNVLGFKSPKQLNESRKRAVSFGWLLYERSGNREVGRYAVTVPANFEGLSDDVIEPIHSVGGTNSGMNSGMNKGRIAERIGDELRNEKVTESGNPSIPIPFPFPKYSPGSEICIPESMNTTEIIELVGKWFRHLESKDKHEKVPVTNSPQEEAFWQQIAKMGPDRFIAAVTKSMAEGWVTLREDRAISETLNGNGKHRPHESAEWIKVVRIVRQYPSTDDWKKRREILGQELFEACKATKTDLIREADDYQLKTLAAIFEQHLTEIRARKPAC